MPRAAPYNRDTALAAAMSIFWEKGFHATSLKDLESALAMKPGSIYAAFDNKENLYLLALERYFKTSSEAFRAQAASADSPLSALANHFHAYAQLTPGDKNRRACMLTKTLVDTSTTEPAIANVTREYLAAMQHEFARAFSRARDLGELPKTADPDRLARRFQTNVAALRLAVHQGMDAAAFTELAEDMALEIEQLRS